MKAAQVEETALLLQALTDLDKDVAECFAMDSPRCTTMEIWLPPKMWGEILKVARSRVLKRLATLGIKVEP